jgi:hypothetical protein
LLALRFSPAETRGLPDLSLHLCSALAAVAVLACLGAAPAAAAPRCAKPGYSYGGLVGVEPTRGVSATITAVSAPLVESGHVAGWIGVAGGGAAAPTEWLQVGLNAVPGTRSRLYYESRSPGEGVRYVELDADVPVARSLRVRVLKSEGAWRVWVDGESASGAIALPHDGLSALALAESWDGGTVGCNRAAYRFDGLATAETGGWRRFTAAELLADQGHRVVRRGPSLAVFLGPRLDLAGEGALQLSTTSTGPDPVGPGPGSSDRITRWGRR